MILKDILLNVNTNKILGDTKIDISNLTCESNLITKGCLFICIQGERYDGHLFVRQAELYGASAIVCEKELNTTLTQIIVDDSRETMSIIAQNFYDNPAKKLKIIGVTGTNGKTTTTHMIYRILEYCGVSCGVIGTLGAYYKNKIIDCKLTTPDPILFNKILRDMVDDGIEVVAMEVSAHACYYNKLYGIQFEVGILTNITRDHLDFFATMENYIDAKKSFFDKYKIKYVVLNSDDKVSTSLKLNNKNILTYGIDNPADIFAINIKRQLNYTKFVINLFDCISNVKLKLIGLFNIYNALASLTAVSLVGVSPELAIKGLEGIGEIEGRLQRVYNGEYSIFVDYAHTPDSLEKALFTLKTYCSNNFICLFGCGGNRDSTKRSLMGEISGKIADFTIITSDNPRFEEPMDIIHEIEKGIIKVTKKYIIIQDRESAIEYGVKLLTKGDILLVAGKGSEKYQEVLGIKKPFDDYSTIIEKLQGKEI